LHARSQRASKIKHPIARLRASSAYRVPKYFVARGVLGAAEPSTGKRFQNGGFFRTKNPPFWEKGSSFKKRGIFSKNVGGCARFNN